MPGRCTLAAGSLLALLIATAAACSSGSGSKSAAAPTTVPSASSTTSASSTPSGSSTTSGASSQPCSTTSATGGSGGGDILVPGDIPDNQAYVAFQSSDGYHINVPEGWARTQSASGVVFTDKFNSIRVEVTSAPAAPSVASAQTSDVAGLAASAPCFQAGKVSQVTRSAGSAILVTYRADSNPDPVTGKVVLQDVERYEFWQSGRQATVTLSSPRGSDNVDPWRKVTDSFQWGP